jgi:hypothetical protein
MKFKEFLTHTPPRISISNWVIAILTIANFILFFKLFGRDKLHVGIDDEILIEQTLGNLWIHQSFSFKNLGTKVGYITKIEGFIRSKDRDVSMFRRKIEALKWYPDANSFYLPLMEISLLPEEQATTTLLLAKEPDRITRDSSAVIEALMLDEAEQAARRAQYENFKSVEASPKLSRIIDDFIKNRTIELKHGEYEYIIQITKNNEETPFITKCYSFFIYPENIFQFNEAIKDYKKYSRLQIRNARRPAVSIPLTEIQNQKIIRSLEAEIIK